MSAAQMIESEDLAEWDGDGEPRLRAVGWSAAADGDLASIVDLADHLPKRLDDDDECFEDHDRHVSLSRLCQHFHDMLVGEEAERLLASGALDKPGAIWVPPTWTWRHSLINVGRKDRGLSGERLTLPIRLQFSARDIVVLTEATLRKGKRVDWVATGLGHTGSGTVHLTLSEAETVPVEVLATGDWEVPQEVRIPVMTSMEMRSAATALVERGREAKWAVLTYFERYVRSALHKAHTSVALELSQYLGSQRVLLDETKIEALANAMLLGEGEHRGSILPLVNRCLKPGAFLRVEPMKYIRDSLRRDANAAVRNAIGDPHIGPKVRKLAAELGTRDLSILIPIYRERYPKDRLSVDRAEAALNVEADPMASWWTLYPSSETGAE